MPTVALSSVDAHSPSQMQSAMLARVQAIARGPLAAMVDDIDRKGTYPAQILKDLGRAGLYRAQTSLDGAPDLAASIRGIAEVSKVCGATGFMVWCQAACALYMERCGNPALGGDALLRHINGDTLGGTALSNPMKAMTGIEPMLLRAEPTTDGYLINGVLPWVSNLGSDHYFGGGATVYVHGNPVHDIMFMVHCQDPGIELRACPSFAGMEGTGTWGVRFTDFKVTTANLITDRVPEFLDQIRPAFILLQVGMGLGIAQAAIETMWAVEQQLGHVNQFLHDRPADLQAELDALSTRTDDLAGRVSEGGPIDRLDVLDVRAHASELALRAAQSALLHQGARGYLLSSPVQRRVRESHFVAIVTPALKHLRREMAKQSAQEMPA